MGAMIGRKLIIVPIVLFMYLAIVLQSSPVASHTCTPSTLLSIIPGVPRLAGGTAVIRWSSCGKRANDIHNNNVVALIL
jgi:hypothetical protein